MSFEEVIVKRFDRLISGIDPEDRITFTKGYDLFEELYECNKEYLERKEIKQLGWTEVVLTKKDEVI